MKLWKIVLLSLLAILAVAGIGFLRWMRPYNLETERTAARAAGIPLTEADLKPVIPPSNENAAADYEALMALEKRRPLNTHAFDAALNNTTLALMDDRQAAALKTLLASRPDVARLVHAAAAKPHANFPHEWTVAVEFPQFAHMREAAKWLRWESILLARQGRYDEAIRNQALGFRTARHAAEEPNIIGLLVSIASESLTLSGFEDILTMAGPNAAVADAVRREIAAYDPGRDLQICLRHETLYGLTAVRQMTSGGEVRPPTTPAPAPWKTSDRKGSAVARWLYMDPSEAVYLHWMTRIVRAAGTPLSGRQAAVAAVQAEMDRSAGNRPTYLLASIVTPVYSKAAERETHSAARRTLVSAMASVLSYRAQNGRYPDTLSAAVNPVPVDPYTGKPLGYRREGEGVAVFAEPDVTGEDAKSAAKLRQWSTVRYPPVKTGTRG